MAIKKLTSGTTKAKLSRALIKAAITNSGKVHVVSRGSGWATKSG